MKNQFIKSCNKAIGQVHFGITYLHYAAYVALYSLISLMEFFAIIIHVCIFNLLTVPVWFIHKLKLWSNKFDSFSKRTFWLFVPLALLLKSIFAVIDFFARFTLKTIDKVFSKICQWFDCLYKVAGIFNVMSLLGFRYQSDIEEIFCFVESKCFDIRCEISRYKSDALSKELEEIKGMEIPGFQTLQRFFQGVKDIFVYILNTCFTLAEDLVFEPAFSTIHFICEKLNVFFESMYRFFTMGGADADEPTGLEIMLVVVCSPIWYIGRFFNFVDKLMVKHFKSELNGLFFDKDSPVKDLVINTVVSPGTLAVNLLKPFAAQSLRKDVDPTAGGGQSMSADGSNSDYEGSNWLEHYSQVDDPDWKECDSDNGSGFNNKP